MERIHSSLALASTVCFNSRWTNLFLSNSLSLSLWSLFVCLLVCFFLFHGGRVREHTHGRRWSSINTVQCYHSHSLTTIKPNHHSYFSFPPIFTSTHNQKSLSLPFSVDLNGTSIHLSSTVHNFIITLDQNLSFLSSMSIALVKSAILNCVESILSVTTCHKMLWRHRYLLWSCPESITAILY